jgi:hypothetical protein
LLLQLPRRPGQLGSVFVLASVPPGPAALHHLACHSHASIASWLPVHLSYTHNSIVATCWHHHCSFHTVVSLLSCRLHDPACSVIPCLPHNIFRGVHSSICACQVLCLPLRHALSMFVCPLRYSLALLSPAVLRQPCCSVGGVWSINNCFFSVCAVLQDCCVSNTRPSKHACWCCSLPCVSGGPAGGLHAATARGVLSGGSGGRGGVCVRLVGPLAAPLQPSFRFVTVLSALIAQSNTSQPHLFCLWHLLCSSLWHCGRRHPAPLSFGSLQSPPNFFACVLVTAAGVPQAGDLRMQACAGVVPAAAGAVVLVVTLLCRLEFPTPWVCRSVAAWT